MNVLEAKVVFVADDNKKYQKKISDFFYEFGITGLKIDEPLQVKNILDYYKDEQLFIKKDHSISAYFPNNSYSQRRKNTLEEEFYKRFGQLDDLIYTLEFYELDPEEYENNWKKHLFPERVSDSFVVKPTWREYEREDDNTKVINLDPGRAFGTGSHPTTALCLEALEEVAPFATMLDVGTGSGILMIAGSMLGAKTSGIDVDPLAIQVAKENLDLNKCSDYDLFLGTFKKLPEKKYDVVVANIIADILIDLMEGMISLVNPGGKLILSGIIEEKLPLIKKALQKYEGQELETNRLGDWYSVTYKFN